MPEERALMIAAGMDDMVSKPYAAGDLFRCMGHWLGLRYRYEKDSEEEAALRFDADAAALLDDTQRERLRAAVLAADVHALRAVAAELEGAGTIDVAASLRAGADTLAFSAIWQAITAKKEGV
jgi:hypothetical protein